MSHIEEDVLDQYAMGTLSEESVQEVEEHLLICQSCQTRLAETDEFLAVFSAAVTEQDAQSSPGWKGLVLSRTGLWAGAAALASLAVFLIVGPRQDTRPSAVTILMQSFRGADSDVSVAPGKPMVLVFDLPVHAPLANFEIDVVDTVGNEVVRSGAELRSGRLTARFGKLAGGSYWVRVYRTQPTRELVAEYGLRVESTN
jgi:hypothetical protein